MKEDTLREEFYKQFTFSHTGDSGMGGNTPQEPVWEMDTDPKEVMSWFISKLSQEKLRLKEKVSNTKFEMNVDEYLPLVEAWNEKDFDTPFDAGYNQALQDVLNQLN